MLIIFILVVGVSIGLAVKNKVDPDELDPNDLPEQTHGNFKLEIAWTIAPMVLLTVVAVFTWQEIWDLEEKNDDITFRASSAEEVENQKNNPLPLETQLENFSNTPLDVMVIGQQWWWEYRYDIDGDGFFKDANNDGVIDEKDRELPLDISLDDDDIVTATELVIPSGQQVDLIITSRDVIHSYWIPRLNGKRDAVPGRLHTWSLESFEPGKYSGWCTEFCGMSHARMRMSAIALEKPQFDEWIANQATLAEIPAEEGEEGYDEDLRAGYETFQANCASCHVISEPDNDPEDNLDTTKNGRNIDPPLLSGAAPNLTHFATRSTFAGGIYGTYNGRLGDPNSNDLDPADYLKLSEFAKQPSNDTYSWNVADLKPWVKNAPEQKDMDPVNQQGMIAFENLTEEQLDQVVAYLATLD